MVSSAAGKLIHGAGDGVGVERAVAVAVCVGLGGNDEVGTRTVGEAVEGMDSGSRLVGVAGEQPTSNPKATNMITIHFFI